MSTQTAVLPQIGSERSVSRPWTRWLRPSLTDFFFLSVLFWLFLADVHGWDRLLYDGDTALHTRTGDFILDHGRVPTTDPFSFTKPGERWFAFQWLTGVVFAALNRASGLKGIVLLCGVVIALYLTILLRDMVVARGTNGLFAILLVMIAANASIIHYHARPHLFTLLFLTVANALIGSDRRTPSWRIWLLIPLTILWTNMHSGFPALLAVVALLAGGSVLSREWVKARRYAGVLAGCLGATLINPNGIALHLHIARFLNNPWAMANISEYQSPVFRSEAMSLYMGLLFAGLIACGRYIERRQWAECFWIVFFAAASLTSARHVPLYIVTALPLIGQTLTEYGRQLCAGKSAASAAGVLHEFAEKASSKIAAPSVWIAVVIACVALFTGAHSWPRDLSGKYFPRSIVAKHQEQLASARVFTTDQWGDYLLWKGYPRQRVFMDGRSDFFGEEIGRDYAIIGNAQPGWRERLDHYRVNMLLVPAGTALSELVEHDSAWRIVDRDDQAVLLERAVNR
jgi:hypothetical protein